MIRMNFGITLQYEVIGQPADFILNIHAANTPHQTVVTEDFSISQSVPVDMYEEPFYGTRFARFKANAGPITVRYNATVDIDAYIAEPSTLRESPIAEIPQAILHYVYPSRYCQSDRLHKFAAREFGQWAPGFSRVQAIAEWIRQRTVFESGASKGTTSAVDTLIEQAGVCRDFAHLMIALCRAVNIPARFATGIDYGAAPELGACDFHAYVEVYLSGRWYIIDPSGISPPQGLIRLGTGRDAADVAFATIFGQVNSWAPTVFIDAVNDPANGYEMPVRNNLAVSTQA
ncbi:transglutaminase-like domain-containing protein [Methyloradius palustris]|uniref:Transglutaminase n=1 Tax=Methyloradius palustris TaxID=2778876 RepID=A0A8D5G1S0_9PROT|nr:transglutaminase family protein [Methyloradius palustris]BCM26282.1 transglutaminase [Methyloradius palustris]